MAIADLTGPAIPPAHELRAFARAAARLLAVDAPHAGGRRSPRPRRGAGHEFLEHRDYQPNDDSRWIDWLQTARFARPLVREFRAETSRDWLLCVDGSSSMSVAGAVKWRHASRLAAALAYLLLDVGHRVGIAIYASDVARAASAGRGHAQYLRIVRILTGYRPPARDAGSKLGCCAARLPGFAAVVVLSDFLAADGMRAELTRLAATCSPLHALAIGAVAERRLPDGGRLELVDVETGERRALRAGVGARADAIAAASEARLASFARSAGIAFSRADAAASWQQTLLRHLRRGVAG